MVKTILIIIGLIIITWILMKVIFPLLWKLLKWILPAIIIIGVVIFIGAILLFGSAAFVGIVEMEPEPNEVYTDPYDKMYAPEQNHSGKTLREEYEWVDKKATNIENKIDSLEGGKLDMWVRKQQAKARKKLGMEQSEESRKKEEELKK
jgi:hypothetical protein